MVLIIDLHFHVVLILPRENLKPWLIGLESDTKPYFSSKKHLRVLDKVIHDVFKLRFQCFLVYNVEVNVGLGCQLHTNVTFDVEDLPSEVFDDIVLFPLAKKRRI